jgi:hypothetical protein
MPKKPPDDLAKWLGHAAVGGLAALATAKFAKAAAPAIVVAIVAILIHAELDAPVSQALSELGL